LLPTMTTYILYFVLHRFIKSAELLNAGKINKNLSSIVNNTIAIDAK